jgi:hypothetical protein
MEALIEVLKYSFPLFGVAVGWLLGQLAERSKIARDDRKKIKRTIYYLLEVRHQLALYCIREEELSTYYHLIKKKFSNYSDVLQMEEVQFKTTINQLLKTIIGEKPLASRVDIESLNDNYAKCVDSLSEIDPILAFRLHGRQNVKDLLKEAIYRANGPMTYDATEGSLDVGEISTVFSKLEPNVLRESIADLDEIILALASMADKKTFKDIRARLKGERTSKEMADLERTIENLFAGLLSVSQ